MSLLGVRRPRIIEPRCLRCRRPIESEQEQVSIDALCIDCGRSGGWSESREAGNA
jgi:hypothetical protein